MGGEGRGMAASSLLGPLRPKPFRGDVIAAGVVVLTTLVWLLRLRFAEAWGDGVHMTVAAVPFVFVTVVAILAPMEREAPRAYQSVLYVASYALALAFVVSFSETLGAERSFSTEGTTTWTTAALAVLAFGFAIERNSAVCTLLAALSAGVSVIAAVGWIFSPEGISPFRYVLLGLVVVYGFAAVGQRDRHLRHGVALIDAAGLAVLGIGLTLLPLLPSGLGISQTSWASENASSGVTSMWIDTFGVSTEGFDPSVAWGWELLLVAAGFGLIAYSSVDRQPGPAYLGVLNLILFAIITSLGVTADGATLLGWPVVLALAAVALLAIGLRPTTPAPPPPDVDAPEAPPLPLR